MKAKVTKYLLIALVVMGIVHIVATFSPVISGRLTPLTESMQKAMIYMSLMCGALLVMGGSVAFMLASKLCEQKFLTKPFMLILIMMAVDGILAAVCMPHNPCAWVIMILALPLLAINLKR